MDVWREIMEREGGGIGRIEKQRRKEGVGMRQQPRAKDRGNLIRYEGRI